MREDDGLFSSIPVYDGTNPFLFECWLNDIDQASHLTNRSLRKELMKKSGGVVCNTLSMIDDRWKDYAIVAKLRQDFSLMSTMNRAREELKSMVQPPGQPISVYIYKYDQAHFLATSIRAHNENNPSAIQEFIASLDTNLKRMVAKKYAEV